MEKRVLVKVEFRFLDGKKFQKTKTLPTLSIRETFPTQFKVGDFISQTEEKPQGMFIISEVSVENNKFVLNEVDCDPKHWKGDGNGRGHGPDDDCTKKKCSHLNNCPISAHIIMMSDVD